jgi:hypothetical protein
MASGKNEFLSQALLNYIFNGAAAFQVATLYIGLYTVTPSVSAGGTEVTNAGNYARKSVSVASSNTNWATISGSTTTVTSQAAFTFSTANATWSSGSNITGAGLLDSGTYGAGNLWYFGDVTVAKPVFNGDTASFSSGAMTVQEL